MGLIQISRHQRRNANKMQLQKDWKNEMAENFMKPLQEFEKDILNIVTFAVYILQENVTFNKQFIRPDGIGFCTLKKQK